MIIYFIFGGLAVLLYHLVGSVASEGQALDKLFKVVCARYVASESCQLIFTCTALGQTCNWISVSESVVYLTVFIIYLNSATL